MAHEMPVSREVAAEMEDYYRDVDVRETLLAYLRRRLGQPALAYASPPSPIVGATESWIFTFRLANAPPSWSGPLVLRIDRVHAGTRVQLEASVQAVLDEQGFPTARVLACSATGDEIGRAFVVMEALEGRAGPAGLIGGEEVGPLGLLLSVPRILRLLPRLMADTLAKLHALDATPLIRRLESEGVEPPTLGGRLDEIACMAERSGRDDLRGLSEWLRTHRPPDPERPSVCHGDFHAFNLMLKRDRLAGVIDWPSVCIADPALDLGVIRAQLCITQLPVAGLPESLVHGVQIALLRSFEHRYRRLRALDESRVRYFELIPCAAAVGRMVLRGAESPEEPLAPAAWEHPRSLARLVALVREMSGIALRV